jgi:hypothetical protein
MRLFPILERMWQHSEYDGIRLATKSPSTLQTTLSNLER